MPLTNKNKNSKTKGKNFLTIVKGHLEDDCDGCKKLNKEEEFEVKTVTKKVKSLLAEFANVIPSEMPNGLPFLQDIQHNIDLVLSLSLPNLPHYYMSPHEHAIVQRAG